MVSVNLRFFSLASFAIPEIASLRASLWSLLQRHIHNPSDNENKQKGPPKSESPLRTVHSNTRVLNKHVFIFRYKCWPYMQHRQCKWNAVRLSNLEHGGALHCTQTKLETDIFSEGQQWANEKSSRQFHSFSYIANLKRMKAPIKDIGSNKHLASAETLQSGFQSYTHWQKPPPPPKKRKKRMLFDRIKTEINHQKQSIGS